MENVNDIYEMLNWENPSEIQLQGIRLAQNINDLSLLIRPPAGPSVWEHCAKIISEKSDGEIEPYLKDLFEWLQDLNWPGAYCIFDRLQKYADDSSYDLAFDSCLKYAQALEDDSWESNLRMLNKKG